MSYTNLNSIKCLLNKKILGMNKKVKSNHIGYTKYILTKKIQNVTSDEMSKIYQGNITKNQEFDVNIKLCLTQNRKH